MFSFFKPRTQASAPLRTLSPQDVHELMSTTSMTLIDVREPAEHGSERIPGAVNIPLSQLQARAGFFRCPAAGRKAKLHPSPPAGR